MMMPLWEALTRNEAATRPDHANPRLRTRTYAVPYPDVWDAAHHLAAEVIPRWTLRGVDVRGGDILAEARTKRWNFVDDVRIHVYLDENAQTRVDMESSSRQGPADLGTNARRIRRFLEALDAAVS